MQMTPLKTFPHGSFESIMVLHRLDNTWEACLRHRQYCGIQGVYKRRNKIVYLPNTMIYSVCEPPLAIDWTALITSSFRDDSVHACSSFLMNKKHYSICSFITIHTARIIFPWTRYFSVRTPNAQRSDERDNKDSAAVVVSGLQMSHKLSEPGFALALSLSLLYFSYSERIECMEESIAVASAWCVMPQRSIWGKFLFVWVTMVSVLSAPNSQLHTRWG